MKFNVPIRGQFYQLDEDFHGFNEGSIFSINYPDSRGFTFCCFKKNNKDSPARKFGQEHFNVSHINRLNATEFHFGEI